MLRNLWRSPRFWHASKAKLQSASKRKPNTLAEEGSRSLLCATLSHHDDGITTLTDAENNVLIGMLILLAFRVSCTWGEDHRIGAELHLLGDSDQEALPAMVPAGITDADPQDEVVEHMHALESRFVRSLDGAEHEIGVLCGNPRTEGVAYREIANGRSLRTWSSNTICAAMAQTNSP